jgi:dihydrofolate synthase / folylpolyglutamate synthase
MVKNLSDYLYALRNHGSSFGVERMQRFSFLLGKPEESFPVVHVAGTNGKGSVCSMLDAIYRANGYKVGLFSSPHLVDLGERIRVNGQIASMDEITRWVTELKPVAERMEADEPGMHPTFFEFMTAVAFLRFREEKVDLAILETGLGGRLDSTNVVNPQLSVITTISKDHCALLGNEIEDIAGEKAGIVKKGRPVLTGWLKPEANQVVERIAREKGAPFSSLASRDESKEPLPQTNLTGAYQKRNAALAIRATEILNERFPVDPETAVAALTQVRLKGRWQVLSGKPTVILDACHNEEAADALRGNLLEWGGKLEVWLGSLDEARAREVVTAVLPFASGFRLFEPSQPRACSFDLLSSLIPEGFEGSVSEGEIARVDEYLEATTENQTILVTGSIYLIGEYLSLANEATSKEGSVFQDLL